MDETTMEEWKEYRLGDVSDITKLAGFEFTKYVKYNPDGEIIAVRALNLRDGHLDLKDIQRIDKETSNRLLRSKLYKGDIVLSYTGTIGACAIITENDKYHLAPNVCKITPYDSIEPFFLYYIIRSRAFQESLIGYAHGSTQPTIPMKTIREIPIKICSKDRQQRIATILSSLDDKIELNRRINANLEAQAQALFKSWLSGCHEEVTIGELSENITDYTKCNNPEVVLINSSDVTEGRFEHHTLSENKDLKGHFKKRFQKGDILYSQVRPRNRHWGYCSFDAENYLASTQLMVIRNRKNIISSILLYQYIIDDYVWMDFTNKTETRSGTFPQGNYEEISSIKVRFGADITQISKELESLYAYRFMIEQESSRLATLRDTLLPRLMSGELKVNEIA